MARPKTVKCPFCTLRVKPEELRQHALRCLRPEDGGSVGMYAGMTGGEVRAALRKSSANLDVPLAWLADVCRIAGGGARVQFVLSVRRHAQADGFTPPMVQEDFAKEGGFCGPGMSGAIRFCLAKGMAERKGESGEDRLCYRLLEKNWPAIPNAYLVLPNAFGRAKKKAQAGA